MKKSLIILHVLIIAGLHSLYAQKVLSLKECYDMALQSNSLATEKENYSGIWKLKDENISKGWLPTIDANANFLYNSEVVDMTGAFAAIPIPGFADAIRPLPHEQYRITLDINQVIYDGGAVKGARELEKAGLDINQQQTEADLYKLKGQVNGYFFGILVLDRQKDLLESYLALIETRIKSLRSALENGVIIRSDIDIMTSEMIRIEQQLGENSIKKASLVRNLSALTGIETGTEPVLIIPALGGELSDDISRPELRLFDMREDQLEASLSLIQSKRYPKAFGFATLGYGNPPGNNFFKDEFAPYYVIGAGVKWNIFDWNKSKNEKQQIMLQKGIIESRKTDLTETIKRSLETKSSEISAIRSLIEKDSELIALRKRITSAAESQYENGTITATEFMNEVNSEREAMIKYEIHKINLVMAQVEYLNIAGKEPGPQSPE